MLGKMLRFTIHGDARGSLIALENLKDFPFEVRRVYYIFDTLSNVRRGFHAHKKLKQVLICVNGSCKIHLDNGLGETKEVLLDRPDIGLFLGADVWREMYDFSDHAVLLVLASEYYDEKDYIRDYNKFLEYVREQAGGSQNG